MSRSRIILLIIVLIFVVAVAWFWWSSPTRVDMAAYAPSDSLLYLEADEPAVSLDVIANTDAWRTLQPIVHPQGFSGQSPVLRWLVAHTGFGPIQSVVLSRAQIAVVFTDLKTIESGETLNIKPDAAILVETHTSPARTQPLLESLLTNLANKTYGHPNARKVNTNGVEYLEWSSPDNSRQIVAVVDGTLAIIGTSESVVDHCLAVKRGRQPSLKGDTGLQTMRQQLNRKGSLAFGYVPADKSAKLLGIGLPALLGRAPGDADFQKFVTTGATKVFGSLGWVASETRGGIEDRYQIDLAPAVINHLKPTFSALTNSSDLRTVAPPDAYSVTVYKFADPRSTWMAMKLAISSQVDALSTIVFSTIMKSALASFGLDDPEAFLTLVKGEIFTVRVDSTSEHSLLIARVDNEAQVREFVTGKMGLRQVPSSHSAQLFENPQLETAAALFDGKIILGTADDLDDYLNANDSKRTFDDAAFKKLTFYSSANAANITTYANDEERLRAFASSFISPGVTNVDQLDRAIGSLPYAVTETTINDQGISRVTRSPLGQFTNILSQVVPSPAAATNTQGNR